MNLVIFILFFTLTFPSEITNNIHTFNGYVYAIEDRYVLIDTNDGNGWALFDDGVTYRVADRLIIFFDNIGTPNDIYDDEIVKIIIINPYERLDVA